MLYSSVQYVSLRPCIFCVFLLKLVQVNLILLSDLFTYLDHTNPSFHVLSLSYQCVALFAKRKTYHNNKQHTVIVHVHVHS